MIQEPRRLPAKAAFADEIRAQLSSDKKENNFSAANSCLAPESSGLTRSTLASTVSGQSNPFCCAVEKPVLEQSRNEQHGRMTQNAASTTCFQEQHAAAAPSLKHSSATILKPSADLHQQRTSNPFSESSIADRVKQSRRGRHRRQDQEGIVTGALTQTDFNEPWLSESVNAPNSLAVQTAELDLENKPPVPTQSRKSSLLRDKRTS